MNNEFKLINSSGVIYTVCMKEIIEIYNALFDCTEIDCQLEIIINNFNVLKDFVTQKCGGSILDFYYLACGVYLTPYEVVEYLKAKYNSIEDFYRAMENIKDPTARMFQLVGIIDGNVTICNLNKDQEKIIDNIVYCFFDYMYENRYV